MCRRTDDHEVEMEVVVAVALEVAAPDVVLAAVGAESFSAEPPPSSFVFWRSQLSS